MGFEPSHADQARAQVSPEVGAGAPIYGRGDEEEAMRRGMS